MDRNYWLDLFTGRTWEEFLRNGASVSGFKERRRNIAERIRPGDYLICYLTGLSRFIGVLEVLSESYLDDHTPTWETQLFPVRFKVKVVYALSAKTAIPVHDLKDRLSIFRDLRTPRAWSGFFSGSPAQFKSEDAEVIVEAIKDASTNPVEREFDEKKYWQRPLSLEVESKEPTKATSISPWGEDYRWGMETSIIALRIIAWLNLFCGIIGAIIVWGTMSTKEVVVEGYLGHTTETHADPEGIGLGFGILFGSIIWTVLMLVVCSMADNLARIRINTSTPQIEADEEPKEDEEGQAK